MATANEGVRFTMTGAMMDKLSNLRVEDCGHAV